MSNHNPFTIKGRWRVLRIGSPYILAMVKRPQEVADWRITEGALPEDTTVAKLCARDNNAILVLHSNEFEEVEISMLDHPTREWWEDLPEHRMVLTTK